MFNRTVNISNQCRTHKCSNYCLREVAHTVIFNANIHQNIPDNRRFTRNDGVASIPTSFPNSYSEITLVWYL